MLNAKFLAINKTCDVKDFILKIGFSQAGTRIDFVLLEDLFQDLFQLQPITIKISLVPRQPFDGTHKIYVTKEKLLTNDLKVGTVGEVYFILMWKEGDQVKIKMQYNIISKVDDAQDSGKLKEFVKKIFENFQILDIYQSDEKCLYRFLTPHINGVKRDLAKLRAGIMITYKLEGNSIFLIGYKNEVLYEYARNHRSFKLPNKISLPVRFNNNFETEIIWDDKQKCWQLIDPVEKKILPTGNMEIILGNQTNTQNYESHEERRLHRMQDALSEMKNNFKNPGNETLRKALSEKLNDKADSKILIEDISKSALKLNVKEIYDHFDQDQKSTLKLSTKFPITIINGEAGTGKTEIGAFLALLEGLLERSVLVTSETNIAIDNFLERMHKYLNQLQDQTTKPNIVRIHGYNYRYNVRNLRNYYLEDTIKRIQELINTKCQVLLTNAKENDIRSRFKIIYTDTKILEEIIPLTFDIVLSTYGMLTGRRLKRYRVLEFDYNFIEASSGINTATWAMGAAYSSNWIFLNDSQQLSPTPIGIFIPGQKPRFPDKSEMEVAKKYDPNNLEQRRTQMGWEEKEYKASINSILDKIDGKDSITKTVLNGQYRIHPDLLKLICRAFKQNYQKPEIQSAQTFLDLSQADFLKESKNSRLVYFPCEGHTRTKTLIDKLTSTLKELKKMLQYNDRTISIGITSMNVGLVRDLIFTFQQQRNPQKPSTDPGNLFLWETDNVSVKFSSIKNHQEKEYDLIFLGIDSFRSFQFAERIYTAITRAKSYAFLFGPEVKNKPPNPSFRFNKNDEIMLSLRRGTA